MQFGDLVLRHDSCAFRGIWGETGEPKYVITLDSDSILVDARRLVGMMEHPYNADVNVMSLSMRARISSLVTPFARFLCGDKGYSRYACGHSLSFDAYGLGNYTGKGIYRVAAFDKILRYALPENRVLSHDMLEGAYASCAESGICGNGRSPPVLFFVHRASGQVDARRPSAVARGSFRSLGTQKAKGCATHCPPRRAAPFWRASCAFSHPSGASSCLRWRPLSTCPG